jgi:hypothetical protein
MAPRLRWRAIEMAAEVAPKQVIEAERRPVLMFRRSQDDDS